MKKFLLSLTAVAMATSFAMADTATFDFTKNTYTFPTYQSGNNGNDTQYLSEGKNVAEEAPVTLTFSPSATPDKNGDWRMWTDGLRGYLSSATRSITMNVEAANAIVTSIEFTCKKAFIKTYSIDGATAVNVSENGNAASKFTIDIAGLSNFSLTFTGSANAAIQNLKVNYTMNAGDKTDPGISFAEKTVNFSIPGDDITLQTLTNPNDLPVTYSSSDEEVVKFVDDKLVYVGPGTTTITAAFAGNDTYYAKSVSYSLTITEIKTVDNIAAFLTLEKGETAKFANPVTVVYMSGKYLFVKDATGALQLYNSAAAYTLPYKQGQTISGFEAVRDAYNGTPQGAVAETIATFPAAAEGEETTIEPETILPDDLDASYYNAYVEIKDVTVTMTEGEKYNTYFAGDIQLYDRFNLKPFENLDLTKTYTVEGFYVTYNTTPEIFVTSIVEYQPVSIEGVNAENAEAIYYDLNGRRVLEPAHGIFVKVQGEKVSKVIVK